MSCFQESRRTIMQASAPTTNIGPAPQYTTLLERAAQRTVSAFLTQRADALITVEPGDLSARAQRRCAMEGRGGTECGDMREFVPSDEALFCEVFDAGGLGVTWA
ncbi:hypothetical protein BC826DRAFT_976173, partial [Russula brevipes]